MQGPCLDPNRWTIRVSATRKYHIASIGNASMCNCGMLKSHRASSSGSRHSSYLCVLHQTRSEVSFTPTMKDTDLHNSRHQRRFRPRTSFAVMCGSGWSSVLCERSDKQGRLRQWELALTLFSLWASRPISPLCGRPTLRVLHQSQHTGS